MTKKVKSVREKTARILAEGFGFQAGRVLLGKYEVCSAVGRGWEGEVYLVREQDTGIERAAKFFFPGRSPARKAAILNAKKLHKLRHCSLAIQYHAKEVLTFRGMSITCLLSEYIEGEPLSQFLERQPGKRLPPFQALHLLYSLVEGMECIHGAREAHGDLHGDNIIVQRHGLGFELHVLDFYHDVGTRRQATRSDIVEMVRILYETIGGGKYYARMPEQVKSICRGMKSSLILERFKSATQLRQYLENLDWG